MDPTDLPDATLDCWVERAELLRLNPRASAADIASISHWPRYTLDPELAEPIIERAQIVVDEIDDPGRGPHAIAVSLPAPSPPSRSHRVRAGTVSPPSPE